MADHIEQQPIPPTQYQYTAPELEPHHYPYPEHTPYQISMPQPVALPTQEKKENGWALGKWQWIAMAVGTLIYFLLYFALNKLDASLVNVTPINNILFNSIGDISYLPSIMNLLYGLVNIVPMFFGARFGPWVGAVVALGVLPATSLAFGWPTESIFWINYLIWPFLGFIPGIAFVVAKSIPRNKTRALVIFGTLMGFFAIFSNNMVLAAVYATANKPSFSEYFLNFFLSNVGTLLILPIALLLSELVASSNRRA